MTQLFVNSEVFQALKGHAGPVEICAESGEVAGRFFPKLDLSQYAPLEPQVGDEELLRRAQSDEKTYTTAEVLAYLEKL